MWLMAGKTAGCLMWWCKSACLNRPPTLRIPCSSRKGFNLCSLLALACLVISFPCWRLWISSEKAALWTRPMMVASALLLSIRLVASFVLGIEPFSSLTRRMSRAMALTNLVQQENLTVCSHQTRRRDTIQYKVNLETRIGRNLSLENPAARFDWRRNIFPFHGRARSRGLHGTNFAEVEIF